MSKTHSQSLLYFFILFLLGIGGCAHSVKAVPDAVKTSVSEIAFQDLIKSPKAGIGKTVLLGGTIISTITHESGTRLEILQKPLDLQDRPFPGDESYGRFFIEQEGAFLDPAVYEKGRELTLVGKITEEWVRPIGKLQYHYPYIVVSHLHLWKKRAESTGSQAYPPFFCPDWWPYPRPYWYVPYPCYIYPYSRPFIPPILIERHPQLKGNPSNK